MHATCVHTCVRYVCPYTRIHFPLSRILPPPSSQGRALFLLRRVARRLVDLLLLLLLRESVVTLRAPRCIGC